MPATSASVKMTSEYINMYMIQTLFDDRILFLITFFFYVCGLLEGSVGGTWNVIVLWKATGGQHIACRSLVP